MTNTYEVRGTRTDEGGTVSPFIKRVQIVFQAGTGRLKVLAGFAQKLDAADPWGSYSVTGWRAVA